MQIQQGTVNVTNGLNTITSNGADWSLVQPNNIFVVQNRPQSYIIQSTSFDAGTQVWTAVLDRPYGEASSTVSLNYAIVVDFTPGLGIPIIAAGDIETATILTRAFRIIDQQISSGGGGGGGGVGVSYSAHQTGHTFQIGTLIGYDGTNYFIASADTTAHAQVIGIVSTVNTPSTGDFTFQTAGKISGIGTALTPGSLYYLNTSGTAANFDTTSTRSICVLAFKALDASTALILNFSQGPGSSNFVGATSSTPGVPGLVPAPGTGNQSKVIHGDGLWYTNVPDANSLNFSHLSTTPAFNDSDWATLNGSSTKSVFGAIMNLYTRSLGAFQTGSSKYSANGTFTWVCPSNVTKVRITCWGAGACGQVSTPYASGLYPGGGGGGYAQCIIAVSPGTSYTVVVGRGGFENISGSSQPDGGQSSFAPASGASGANTIVATGGYSPTYILTGSGASANFIYLQNGAGGQGSLPTLGTNGVLIAGSPGAGLHGGDCPNGGLGARKTGGSSYSAPTAPGGAGSGNQPGMDGQVLIEW